MSHLLSTGAIALVSLVSIMVGQNRHLVAEELRLLRARLRRLVRRSRPARRPAYAARHNGRQVHVGRAYNPLVVHNLADTGTIPLPQLEVHDA